MSTTLSTPVSEPAPIEDDDILDNFGETDDGTPIGLGGEQGKQSEPASSTLEADLVSGTKPLTADRQNDAGSDDTDNLSVEDQSDIPNVLLQMAGYSDAASAAADGLGSAEMLHAFIRGRAQSLSKQSEESVGGELYGNPKDGDSQVEPGGLEPFKLPEETLEMMDPDLRDVMVGMNEHYQKQIATLQAATSSQSSKLSEAAEFDNAVQGLGAAWADTFGEGSGEKLVEASRRDPMAMANFQHRKILFDDVQAIRAVQAERGLPPMKPEQEIQFALLQRYPDRFKQSISGATGTRPGVTASRPTQRRTPPRSQSEKTLSAVNALLAKKGRPALDVGDGDDFDGEV